jgi:hypothetical protein
MSGVTKILIAIAALSLAAAVSWYFSPYQRCIRIHGGSDYAKVFCGHLPG